MAAWIARATAVLLLSLIVHGVASLFGGGVWWGSLLTGLVIYLGLGIVGKQLLRSLLVSPFRMKGQVLAGATVEVHGVEPTDRPMEADVDGDDADDEDCPEADMNFFWIDVTITPRPQANLKFRHWDPSEICLVPHDADVGPKAIDDDEDLSYVDSVQIWRDGTFIDDANGEHFDGSKRVRLLMAVDPKLTTAKFRYYFEAFGTVELHRSVALAA